MEKSVVNLNRQNMVNLNRHRVVNIIANCTQGNDDSKRNGELLTDTTGLKIDASYFISVTIDSFSKIKYLGKKSKKTYIVNINLDTVTLKPQVYIKKPVIYLYPHSEMDIHLKINFAGK